MAEGGKEGGNRCKAMGSITSPPPSSCNSVHNGVAKVECSSCVSYFQSAFNVCCYVRVSVTEWLNPLKMLQYCLCGVSLYSNEVAK
jgi:hypothetical protein